MSLLKSFDLYSTFLNDLSVGFNNNSYGWLLSNIIKDTISQMVPWARKLDLIMYFKEQEVNQIEYMASDHFEMFNILEL